jgi:hypothetical protein
MAEPTEASVFTILRKNALWLREKSIPSLTMKDGLADKKNQSPFLWLSLIASIFWRSNTAPKTTLKMSTTLISFLTLSVILTLGIFREKALMIF